MKTPKKPRWRAETFSPPLPRAVQARVNKRIRIVIGVVSVETPLDRFLGAVRAGDLPERRDIRIVAAQLERVLAGETFGRAFHLQEGQGSKASEDTARSHALICAEMEELRKEGLTLEDAAELVRQRHSLSAETVSKLHKSTNKGRREQLAFLQHVGKRGRN